MEPEVAFLAFLSSLALLLLLPSAFSASFAAHARLPFLRNLGRRRRAHSLRFAASALPLLPAVRGYKLIAAQVVIDLSSIVFFIITSAVYFGTSSDDDIAGSLDSRACAAFGALIHVGCVSSMATLTLMGVERRALIVTNRPLSDATVCSLFASGVAFSVLHALAGLGGGSWGHFALNDSLSLCYVYVHEGTSVILMSALVFVCACIPVLVWSYGQIGG